MLRTASPFGRGTGPTWSPLLTKNSSADVNRAASGSIDGTVAFGGVLHTGDQIAGYPSFQNGVVFKFFLCCHYGHRMATPWATTRRGVWNSGDADVEPLGVVRTGHTDLACAVALTRYGHRLATGSVDKTGPAAGCRQWADPLGPALSGYTNVLHAVAFSGPDEQRLTSVGLDGTVPGVAGRSHSRQWPLREG